MALCSMLTSLKRTVKSDIMFHNLFHFDNLEELCVMHYTDSSVNKVPRQQAVEL
jgi:hypothetical protein